MAERYRRVSRAVGRIEQAGARITYDYQRGIGFLHGKYFDEAVANSRRKDWLQNIIYFPEQISIHSRLAESQLTEIVDSGGSVGTITDLVISSNITDEHAEQLSRYTRLQRVTISSHKLTSRGAACLIQHPRLIRLELRCYNVDDSLVAALNGKPIPSTLRLVLDHTDVSKAVAKQLCP